MSDSLIKIGMDVSGVKSQAQDFVNAIESGNQAVVKLFKTMATADQAGNPVKLLVEGLHQDGTRMRAELIKTAEGWEKAQFQIDKASKAMLEAKERNMKSSDMGTTRIRNTFLPEGFEPLSGGQAAKIEAEINRIRKALADGKVSVEDFNRILDQVQKNPKSLIPGLDADQQKVAKAMRAIAAEVEKVNKAQEDSAKKAEAAAEKKAAAAKKAADAVALQKQRTEEAAKAENALRAAIAAPKTVEGVKRYEDAINKVRQAIETGKVSYERFQQLLAQVKGNPSATIPGLTGSEQKVVNALRDIQGELDQTAAKSKSLFISWDGIFRLMQAQVIKRVFAEFQGQVLASIETAKQFSIAIAEIQTISRDANLTTEQWRSGLTALSDEFGNTQADVAEGAYQALSNQVGKAKDVFNFMATAQKFAAATNSTTEQSINLLSSAIKGFRLEASETDRIAGAFFKTIELGRVRARDMAGTFGRVGVTANELGVSLEQVLAGVATVTVKGTNFADSTVLMTNLLQKLLRPTDAMKELFKEWGVATGEQAIQTFGFVGVLQRLEIEAQKGSARLGDLLTNIRAVRGGFNFTGEGLKEFQKNLKEIQTSTNVDEAAKTVLQSTGKQIQIEIQRIKNMFVNDFGDSVLKTILSVRDGFKTIGFKDLSEVIAFTIQRVKEAVQVWLIYRATLIAVATVNASAATSFGVLVAAVAPFAVAFAGGLLFSNWVRGLNLAGEAVESITDKFERLSRVQTQIRFDALATAQKVQDNKLVNEQADQITSRIQTLLKFVANSQSVLNELRKTTAENLKQSTEAMKLSGKTYFDELNNRIKSLQDKVTQAKSIIESSKKLSADLPRRTRNEIFDARLQYASEGRIDPISGFVVGEEKIALIKKKLLETIQLARQEAAKGTKESIEESNRLYEEAARQRRQLFDAEEALRGRNFEEQVRRGGVTPTGFGPDGQPIFERKVQTVQLERDLNALMQERLKVQEQIRASKEAEIKATNEAIAREKEKKRELQEQFDKLEKLKFFNDQGEVDKKYKGPGGIEKARAEFEAIEKRIRELAGSDSASGQWQIFSDLQRQKLALMKELSVAERQENANTLQAKLQAEMDAIKKVAEARKAALAEQQTKIAGKQTDLTAELKVIKDNTLAPRPDFQKPMNFFNAEPARKAALEALKLVEEAQDAFSKDQTPQKAQAIRDAVAKLNEKIAEYTKLRTGFEASEVIFGGDNKRPSERGENASKLAEQIQSLFVGAQNLRGVVEASKAQIDDLDAKIAGLPATFKTAAEGAAPAAKAMADSFAGIAKEATALVAQLVELNRQVAGLRGGVPPAAPAPPAEEKFFGGKMNYMNFGGFVPRGSDQIPAMIGRDEYIMTGAATKKFLPLLKAMNSGGMSPATNSGGSITNVGDIHVNVSGGSTSSDTVREIGTKLRRGIRRGTINLEK